MEQTVKKGQWYCFCCMHDLKQAKEDTVLYNCDEEVGFTAEIFDTYEEAAKALKEI